MYKLIILVCLSFILLSLSCTERIVEDTPQEPLTPEERAKQSDEDRSQTDKLK